MWKQKNENVNPDSQPFNIKLSFNFTMHAQFFTSSDRVSFSLRPLIGMLHLTATVSILITEI